MTGRHSTGPIPVGNDGLTEFERYQLARQAHTLPSLPIPELPPIDPHGYIRLFGILCAIAVAAAFTYAILRRTGVL